jgi:hypothetical protein
VSQFAPVLHTGDCLSIGVAKKVQWEFAECHDDSQNQSLQPGRRHRFHPAQRPASRERDRGEGAWEEEMNISESFYPQFEIQFLELLKELQPILVKALDSLGGKKPLDWDSSYLGRVAVTVNRAGDGYLWLRESGRMDASKLLVRPALEAVFCGTAAMKNKAFLFRKAYSEWEEHKKLIAKDMASKKEADDYLVKMKRSFQQNNYPIKCVSLQVREIAEMADLLPAYEEHYRIYCKFTHSAMLAVSGNLNEVTDSKDTHVVVWCVLMMLNQLKQYTPAAIPDLMPFNEKLRLLNCSIPKYPTTTRHSIS